MPHQIEITGAAGQIKWGYQVVAEIANWSVSADATGGDLTGTVGSPCDEFGVTQQPLRFVVPRPKVEWEWPIESLQIVDGRAYARLGPPKE